jgi:succinate dehydrogenase/fumarate reductase flavoprotein subunit
MPEQKERVVRVVLDKSGEFVSITDWMLEAFNNLEEGEQIIISIESPEKKKKDLEDLMASVQDLSDMVKKDRQDTIEMAKAINSSTMEAMSAVRRLMFWWDDSKEAAEKELKRIVSDWGKNMNKIGDGDRQVPTKPIRPSGK